MSGERRYALYYTPAEKHPLTQAAARWLGRDAFDGAISSVDDHDPGPVPWAQLLYDTTPCLDTGGLLFSVKT